LTYWENSVWAPAKPTPAPWKSMKRRRFAGSLRMADTPPATAAHRAARLRRSRQKSTSRISPSPATCSRPFWPRRRKTRKKRVILTWRQSQRRRQPSSLLCKPFNRRLSPHYRLKRPVQSLAALFRSHVRPRTLCSLLRRRRLLPVRLQAPLSPRPPQWRPYLRVPLLWSRLLRAQLSSDTRSRPLQPRKSPSASPRNLQ